jgi:hypothetical protein
MNTNKNPVLSWLVFATNIRPILEKLNQGAIIRNVIGLFVQCCAILLGLAAFGLWIGSLELFEYVNFFGGIALLLWLLFFLYAAFLCVKVLFIRGKEIRQLPDSEFTVSPIIATLITTFGEMLFIALAVMSVPAMLVIWMARDIAYILIPLAPGDSFFAGVAVFLSCWISGFLLYLFARWIREWTLAIFSIARNVDLIQRHEVTGHTPQENEP